MMVARPASCVSWCALATVDLRDAVQLRSLGQGAFQDCPDVTGSHQPSKLRRIDARAFCAILSRCEHLIDLTEAGESSHESGSAPWSCQSPSNHWSGERVPTETG